MSHPAYPSSADLAREADAEERDVADLVAFRDCDASSRTPSLASVASTASAIPTAVHR
jgi:hypothetical protein